VIPARRLGVNGPEVSAIGLGCAVLSGTYGAVERNHALSVLRRAIDLGITFLDTADVYGNGENEEMVSQAVLGRRQRCFIATKTGLVRSADRGNSRIDGSPCHIASSCEASLRRLGVDAIDLYYLHRVDPQVPIEESVGAMKRLVEEGKVRYLGLSKVSPKILRRAHAVHHIAAVQSEYSLWARDCERDLVPTCRELGIGSVAYYPLGQGLLAGETTAAGGLASGDLRNRIPPLDAEILARKQELLGTLRTIAAKRQRTVGQISLAWLLCRGTDVIPIPGTHNLDHLEENAASAQLELTSEEMASLDAGFGGGKFKGVEE
jgi:aryl-alcohol dehydrogenase-like predicted oxidoreductase